MRFLPFLLLLAAPLSAQVKIHDPIVSTLAKPYGIERRITLKSIDAVHFGPNGSGRLVLTLENSGVKEVALDGPEFAFECVGADGSYEKLGDLKAGQIIFPNTGGDTTVRRQHVVELSPSVENAELVKRLRAAAKRGSKVRLIGRSDMRVEMGEESDFKRKGLKLELGGTARLGSGFKPEWHRKASQLPACGVKG